MRTRHDPFARIHAQTQRIHDQTAALMARTEAMIDKARGEVENTPGPITYLSSRAWARQLGQPLQNTLTDTPTQGDRTIVVFPDGRTLGITTSPQGLLLRKGLLWPARAHAFAPTAAEAVKGWTRNLVRWDTLEKLDAPPVAHVAMQRRAPPPAAPTTTILQAHHVAGRARVAHRLWCVDLRWSVGGKITVRFHPKTPDPNMKGAAKLETVWTEENLHDVSQAFKRQHPTLDRFERSLGWMLFGKWCGWPLSGKDNTPIWLGVTPTGVTA